jgi:hypothetical protein
MRQSSVPVGTRVRSSIHTGTTSSPRRKPESYAAKLIAVDATEAQTEQAQQERYSRLASRLGGAR